MTVDTDADAELLRRELRESRRRTYIVAAAVGLVFAGPVLALGIYGPWLAIGASVAGAVFAKTISLKPRRALARKAALQEVPIEEVVCNTRRLFIRGSIMMDTSIIIGTAESLHPQPSREVREQLLREQARDAVTRPNSRLADCCFSS